MRKEKYYFYSIEKKFDEFTKINHSLKECRVTLLKSTVISHQRLQPRPEEQVTFRCLDGQRGGGSTPTGIPTFYQI